MNRAGRAFTTLHRRIEHLESVNADLLEACRDAYKLIALTRPDTCGYVLVKLSDAISKAEGGTK